MATYHSVPYSRSDRFLLHGLARWNGALAPRVDRFIAVSEAALQWFRRCYGRNGRVIPPPLSLSNTDAAFDADDIPDDAPIVFVGSLSPRKGCRQLLTAYMLLDQSGVDLPPMHLVGAGKAELELRSFVAANDLSARVRLLGNVPESERVQELRRAKVAVFPSLGGEGFGYVLIEALAQGTPVIAGAVKAYVETLGGAPATLVDAHDATALGTAIVSELTGPSRGGESSDRRKAHAASFSVDRIGPLILEEYQIATDRRRAVASPRRTGQHNGLR